MSPKKETRRKFFQKTAVSSLGLMVSPSVLKSEKQNVIPDQITAQVNKEWKNKQAGMAYRKFGRSGIMVSEIVFGTTRWRDDSYIRVIEAGVERGINYIDTSPNYGGGQAEVVIGNYLKNPGNRDKVFVSTKISKYEEFIDLLTQDIYKGLPQKKQELLRKQVQELIYKRGVLKPGYHFHYFGSQERQFEIAYLRNLLLKEYGYKKGWKKQIKNNAIKLFEQSLKKLNTDYVDVLHCPHGAAMPEMMDDEIIRELFDELKQKGAVRCAALSFHNDVAANLSKAIDAGFYDAVMFAYNIVNHSGLEPMIQKAKMNGMAILAMKVAKPVAIENAPQWRLEKLNTAIPDNTFSKYAKSYLWALQNPYITSCVAEMDIVEQVKENVKVVGKKIDLKEL